VTDSPPTNVHAERASKTWRPEGDGGGAETDDGARANTTGRPAGRSHHDRTPHWIFAILSGGIIVLAFLLSVDAQGQVRLPLTNTPLPPSCWFRRMTGIDCAGCGLTRSFISMAHGRFAAAFWFNPVGPVLFVLVAVQLPYHVMQLRRIARGFAPRELPGVGLTLVLLACSLLLQWVVRLAWHL